MASLVFEIFHVMRTLRFFCIRGFTGEKSDHDFIFYSSYIVRINFHRKIVTQEPLSEIKLPDFFNRFNNFVTSFPHLKSRHSKKNTDENTGTHENLAGYLKRCLNFYNINFTTNNVAAKNMASGYSIWQSQILGYRIVEKRWQPKRFNGQTLFIVDGYFEHTGLHHNIIFWSLNNADKVHVFDLLGHGLTSGR